MNKIKQIFIIIIVLLVFSCDNTKSKVTDTRLVFKFVEYDFSLTQTFSYVFSDDLEHFYSKLYLLAITKDEKCLINYNGANIFLTCNNKKVENNERKFIFSNDSIKVDVKVIDDKNNNNKHLVKCNGKVVFNKNNQILETNIIGEYWK